MYMSVSVSDGNINQHCKVDTMGGNFDMYFLLYLSFYMYLSYHIFSFLVWLEVTLVCLN